MLSLENQLIAGYDDKQFLVQQPWAKVNFPPKTLTFQTWEELAKEFHISFFSFAQTEAADDRSIIRDSLSHAIDLAKNPGKYRSEHYKIGPEAYDTWVRAVEAGHGPSHGNWWNGTVWRECREMASKYLSEIASKLQGGKSEKAMGLSKQYGNVATFLDKARDKGLADEKKIKVILEAKKAEEACVNGIEEFLNTF